MARKSLPSYCVHRSVNQAYITVPGSKRVHYLGKAHTPESLARYAEAIARLATGEPLEQVDPGPAPSLSVATIAQRYQDHAREYYRKGGRITSEVSNIDAAMRDLIAHCGGRPAQEFGLQDLQTLRAGLIASSRLTRGGINRKAKIIARMARWAAQAGLMPSRVWNDLRTLSGLPKGRTAAQDPPPVEPVPPEDVEAVLPSLPTPVQGIIRLMLACGCRPGEARTITPDQVDMSSGVWTYRPEQHKTEHHGKGRAIPIGANGQAILNPWAPPSPSSPYFPVPGQGTPYPKDSLDQAVRRACRRTWPEDPSRHWTPNQVRHLVASRIRARYGLEAAQVVLGHSRANTTEIYAQRDLSLAVRIAEELG